MKQYTRNSLWRAALLFLLAAAWSIPTTQAQATPERVDLRGTVYEEEEGRRVPLMLATVSLPEYSVATSTLDDGTFVLRNVPVGKTRITIQFVGKVQIDREVEVKEGSVLSFTMQNEDFKIKEIVVTAQSVHTGKSTASKISRTAIDHLQAASLYDLMALLPGGVTVEPNLSFARQINIRQISGMSDATNANGLGTAIIRDGAPISNNANLQSMSPTLKGSAEAHGGGASPMGGIDVRTIGTDNIESIEVIRGIPSVEYGDLTSGAVIINAKAGRTPLQITAKANPKLYQASISSGILLGPRQGALNVSGEYAHNVTYPTQAYRHFERASGRIMYSQNWLEHKLRSNTSINLSYGKDRHDLNPDDETEKRESSGSLAGITLNTNGTWSINKGWLKSIRYVLSGSYTAKDSYNKELYSVANAPYSMTTTDGAVLANRPGRKVVDKEGKEITHFGADDAANYAVYLPSTYLGEYHINSREINLFGKVVATLFQSSGNSYNRLLAGIDFKSDGNTGRGKTYDPAAPPFRDLSQLNATFRPRAYRDIPFIKQIGLFAEENFSRQIGKRRLDIQAGLRYDRVSVLGGTISPRINASIELLPDRLSLRAGYGITAKMPTLLYLYPEKAYFEYVNINELANEKLEEQERLFMTTTRVFDATNKDLQIAKNRKAEVGLDLRIGKSTLALTAFSERMTNGYSLDNTFDTFKQVQYKTYRRNSEGQIELSGEYPVLSDFYTPGNNTTLKTKGVEFDLNVGRIDAIRTSFQLNGAWMLTETGNTAYNFYDTSSSAPEARRDIAIYAPEMYTYFKEDLTTALRATHNIPEIGFVVTLTAQTVWRNAYWTTYGNDSLPVGFLSLRDGAPHFFKPGQYSSRQEMIDDGLGYMVPAHIGRGGEIKEWYAPYFCFNINVTKEISNYLRVSFFANNMFRSYPKRESKRNPGTFVAMNPRYYFGLELALKLQ